MRLRPMLATVALSAAAATLAPASAVADQKQTDQRFDAYCAKEGRGTFQQGRRFCPMAIANYQILRVDLDYEVTFDEYVAPGEDDAGSTTFSGRLATSIHGYGDKDAGKMKNVRNRFAVGSERPLIADYVSEGEWQGTTEGVTHTWDCGKADMKRDHEAGVTLLAQRMDRGTLRLQVSMPVPAWDCTQGGAKHFPHTLELPEREGYEWYEDFTADDFDGALKSRKGRSDDAMVVEFDEEHTYYDGDFQAFLRGETDESAFEATHRLKGEILLGKYRQQ